MDEGGGRGLSDRADIEKIVAQQVAPLKRQASRARIERIVDAQIKKHINPIEERLDDVERDVQTALTGFELVQRVLTEGIGRLELKLDKQQAEIIQRLDQAEGWIGRRRRMERAAMRVGQLAIITAIRRWLPFGVLFGVAMVAWAALVMVMG